MGTTESVINRMTAAIECAAGVPPLESDTVLLLRDARLELARLSNALDTEEKRAANLMDFYAQQDVGTGLHRIAACIETLTKLAVAKAAD